MVSRESSPQRSLAWAAPKGKYWDWIRSHLLIPSIVELDPQPFLSSTTARTELLASTHSWILGVEGRYDTDLQAWLTDWLSSSNASPEKTKANPASKRRSSTKKSAVPTDVEAARLEPSAPKYASAGAVILGEAWTGHRRTFPLPEPIVPFYWYELYDRLLPWIYDRTMPTTTPDSTPVKESPKGKQNQDLVAARRPATSPSQPGRGLNPRVSIWIDASQQSRQTPHLSILRNDGRTTAPFALVIAESFSTSQLWQDMLSALGLPCMIARPDELRVQLTPDLVFVDLDAGPRSVDYPPHARPPQSVVDLFTHLRVRFPDAMLAGFDSFPRWTCWEKLESLGVDSLFPKPFSTFGLQWCIRRWIDSRPPGTINSNR